MAHPPAPTPLRPNFLSQYLTTLVLPVIKSVPQRILPSFLKIADTTGSSSRYHGHAGDAVECMVCLCKIEDGEKIKKLRCSHLFHDSCLDKWVEHEHRTCPLCRDSLLPHKKYGAEEAAEDVGGRAGTIDVAGEVILISPFSDFSDHDTWWIR